MRKLTQERLKELLNYDAENGVFTHKTTRNGAVKIDDVAGFKHKYKTGNTYVEIGVDNKRYKAHRLAWLFVYGSFPSNDIDHIDGHGTNNRIDNLRDVKKSVNNKNRKLNSNNTTGVVGVYWVKSTRKWLARIAVNWVDIHLGYFVDFNDAKIARKMAEFKYGFHENHGKIRVNR